jgi:diadenosine tetraphosphate (Ap4A) HIT family hydrolase
MTDLAPLQRARMMKVVFAVEQALRDIFNPDKINLASLGNKTPHIHWHLIPRFENDKHFPNSHWAEALRDANPLPLDEHSINRLQQEVTLNIACALNTATA